MRKYTLELLKGFYKICQNSNNKTGLKKIGLGLAIVIESGIKIKLKDRNKDRNQGEFYTTDSPLLSEINAAFKEMIEKDWIKEIKVSEDNKFYYYLDYKEYILKSGLEFYSNLANMLNQLSAFFWPFGDYWFTITTKGEEFIGKQNLVTKPKVSHDAIDKLMNEIDGLEKEFRGNIYVEEPEDDIKQDKLADRGLRLIRRIYSENHKYYEEWQNCAYPFNIMEPIRIRRIKALNIYRSILVRVKDDIDENPEDFVDKVSGLPGYKKETDLDVLLPIFNRRYLDKILPEKIKEITSKNSPIALIIIDIDNFKSFNDKYGHQVGDDVLKLTSSLIKGIVESKGIVARYGGEELCVILSNFDLDEARSIAERIRKTIASYPFNIGDNNIAKITVSLGVSSSDVLIEPSRFIKEVDDALRIAKAKGRNQVIIYDKKQSNLSNELIIIESIKDGKTKEAAKKALEAFKNEKEEDCAKYIKLAFDVAFHKWKDQYQRNSGVLIYKMSIPELIQNNVLNFNLVEFTKFESFLPHIIWFESGNYQISIKHSYTLPHDKANMIFCLKFFINSIIQFKKQADI